MRFSILRIFTFIPSPLLPTIEFSQSDSNLVRKKESFLLLFAPSQVHTHATKFPHFFTWYVNEAYRNFLSLNT